MVRRSGWIVKQTRLQAKTKGGNGRRGTSTSTSTSVHVCPRLSTAQRLLAAAGGTTLCQWPTVCRLRPLIRWVGPRNRTMRALHCTAPRGSTARGKQPRPSTGRSPRGGEPQSPPLQHTKYAASTLPDVHCAAQTKAQRHGRASVSGHTAATTHGNRRPGGGALTASTVQPSQTSPPRPARRIL